MSSRGEKSGDSAAPGLARRLAAIAYDCFLLLAVLILATALLMPFTGGRAIEPNNALYAAYLLAVSFGYFGWFWTHGGQTLGMRTWHLRLESDDARAPSWTQALARFAGACLSWLALGGGFLWIVVDREGRAWHDRLSGTRLVDAYPSPKQA